MGTLEDRDCQDLVVCKVGWGHKEREGYLGRRGPLVHMDLLVQLVHVVDKALWVPQEPPVCRALQECRVHQDTRGSRETLN